MMAMDYSTFPLNRSIVLTTIINAVAEKIDTACYDLRIRQPILQSTPVIATNFLRIINTHEAITTLFDTADYSVLIDDEKECFINSIQQTLNLHQNDRQVSVSLLFVWARVVMMLGRYAIAINNKGLQSVAKQLETEVRSLAVIQVSSKPGKRVTEFA